MDDEPPLHVTRIANEPGRYRVRSQRQGIGHYIIEFGDPEFPCGRCDCIDNEVRIQFPRRNDMKPIRDTCIHIRSVTATIQHARQLCELAGLSFNINIIPEL